MDGVGGRGGRIPAESVAPSVGACGKTGGVDEMKTRATTILLQQIAKWYDNIPTTVFDPSANILPIRYF